MVLLSWIIIIIVVVLILFFVLKMGHMRHKMTLVLIVAIALFLGITFYIVYSENHLDFSTSGGIMNSVEIYFGWLANGFQNFRALTGNAVNMDWTSSNASFTGSSANSVSNASYQPNSKLNQRI